MNTSSISLSGRAGEAWSRIFIHQGYKAGKTQAMRDFIAAHPDTVVAGDTQDIPRTVSYPTD